MARDIAKQKLKKHESYLRNKNSIVSRIKLRRQKSKEWFFGFMEDKICSFCSEADNACLEWHHINPEIKERNISEMVHCAWSPPKILEEIAKCMCVCANCHRKLHAGRMAPI